MNSKYIVSLALVFITSLVLAQPPQENSAELEKRNGFKTIKLGTPIDSIVGATFKKDLLEKEEFPTKLYQVKNESLKNIGEVRVNNITLKTYKGLVYEIEVNTEKDGRLMKGMEQALGKASYNVRTEAYHWRAPSLSLTFTGNKNSLTLVYKSYPIFKMMYEDRGKKIETIAEDF
jgi:hypothetical protein